MSSISDIIENYLIKSLKQTPSGTIQVKRSELARLFQCVPSQINYVISTRFTVEKGYIVESKRGGGGYIRIRKVSFPQQQDYYEMLLRMIGKRITQQAAADLITRLVDEELMTEREGRMIMKLISREVLDLPVSLRDSVRARIMRTVVTTLFANKGE
ncbi:MAG: CtsR family transcriptional regulator [Firmicutes bacterium]|uniref:Transcriptional regulator CtsR n=1 Tax=Melghirimyces thermohalophilus TaxID=1236220 RepID=A0A1G6PB71_9BACL|nr:CtsR family transcriptional regulator [Melghirimyces thermohalophilus]MDA8353442.1 CtsR family transcriptional regulator [Bacillota bacterium]SDC77251.1 transcriptional regulator CtsR [Melghirimyces thermohalophilus]